MTVTKPPINVRDMIDLVTHHQFFIASVRNGNKEYINWMEPILFVVPDCVKTQTYSDEDLAVLAEFAKNCWIDIVTVMLGKKHDRFKTDFKSWKAEMQSKCDEIDRLLKHEEDAKFMREMTPHKCGSCGSRYGPAKDRGLCIMCEKH